MTYNPQAARDFIESLDLRDTYRPLVLIDQGPEDEAAVIFNDAKTQSQIAGSAVFSFVQGVTSQVRESISDSALLAQLVANKNFPADQLPLEWFGEYSKVLQNVGWTLQDSQWTDYTAQGNALEVHQKIIDVLAIALGPTAAALPVIKATVEALSGMKSDSPWIVLFEREAKKASIARFQIGLVENDSNGGVIVSLFAFLIRAQNQITQVLFFKFKNANATFQANSMKVSINSAALTELGPQIRSKIRAYQSTYLSSIIDL